MLSNDVRLSHESAQPVMNPNGPRGMERRKKGGGRGGAGEEVGIGEGWPRRGSRSRGEKGRKMKQKRIGNNLEGYHSGEIPGCIYEKINEKIGKNNFVFILELFLKGKKIYFFSVNHYLFCFVFLKLHHLMMAHSLTNLLTF